MRARKPYTSDTMRPEVRDQVQRGARYRNRDLERRVSRSKPARRLVGASRFSDDKVLSDPIQLIRLLRAFPHIHDPLIQATTVNTGNGRNRMAGDWADAYLAFVVSGISDIEKWWHKHQSESVWRECGFVHPDGTDWVPSFQTTYLRFIELEEHLDAFKAAATQVVRIAMKNTPEAGRHIFVDGAAVQAHRRLEHCCPDAAACKQAGAAARHPDRVPEGSLDEMRKRDIAENPAPELDEALVKDALQPLRKGDRYDYLLDPDNKRKRDEQDGKEYRYQWINGHLYRCADTSVGARHYAAQKGKSKGKFFNGWVDLAASDGYYGAPIVTHIDAGDRQEFHLYFTLYEELEDRLGHAPEAVSGDKALCNRPVFEHNTRKGVATVVPWRQPRQGIQPEHIEDDVVDRHGIPRCPDCGGPGSLEGGDLGFYITDRGTPRIRFRCELMLTSTCGTRSVNCEHEWRLLQPFTRLNPVRSQLRHFHSNAERVHLAKRTRYTVNGAEITTRAKRMGVGWQRLRGEAAIFLDWFRICLRHGFIGSHPQTNPENPSLMPTKARLLKAALGSRRKWGLDLPYGAAAQASGWGRHGPPGSDPPAHVQATKKK